MCGLTRGFYSIWQMNLEQASRLNLLALPLFVFFMMEAVFRLFIILKSGTLKTIDRIAGLDARIHILLAVCYFAYSICFLIFRWKFTL